MSDIFGGGRFFLSRAIPQRTQLKETIEVRFINERYQGWDADSQLETWRQRCLARKGCRHHSGGSFEENPNHPSQRVHSPRVHLMFGRPAY